MTETESIHIRRFLLVIITITMMLGIILLPIMTRFRSEPKIIVGCVRDAVTKEVMSDVQVEVTQDTDIKDTTSDGLYVLRVPAHLKIFHIRYSKAGYLDAWDKDIHNDGKRRLRPTAFMTREVNYITP